MTDAINTKLLVMLGFAVAIAGFGVFRLLGTEDVTGDVGFSSADEFDVVVVPDAATMAPVVETSVPNTRNPFERVDGGTSEPADQEASASDEVATDPEPVVSTPPTTSPEPLSSAPLPKPVFPDPDLAAQDPNLAPVDDAPVDDAPSDDALVEDETR